MQRSYDAIVEEIRQCQKKLKRARRAGSLRDPEKAKYLQARIKLLQQEQAAWKPEA